MTRDLYAARAKGVAARMIGDEMMVMSGRDSALFSLNETAAVLWDAIDGSTPLSRIVAMTVCLEFEVTQDEALRDAEEILRDLAAHGIVILSEQPIPEAAP